VWKGVESQNDARALDYDAVSFVFGGSGFKGLDRRYEVATISTLLKIIGLFCRISSLV